MLPEIDTILEVFERMSLDDKVYFTFPNEEDIQVCILFHRKSDRRNWSLWLTINEEASKQNLSTQHLRQALKGFKISEKNFLKELADILLIQVAFADEFIRQITDVLGKEAVQKSILQTQNFMDELNQKIQSLLHDTEKTHKEDKKQLKASNKTKFKIVK